MDKYSENLQLAFDADNSFINSQLEGWSGLRDKLTIQDLLDNPAN